jgi:DNA-binding MarR family transcriptional regulator
MAIQEAFVALAKDKSLSGRPMRVLTYMMGRLDWDNYITLSQVEIAGELDLHRQHVHAAIKLLVERGIIQEGRRLAVPTPTGLTVPTAGR